MKRRKLTYWVAAHPDAKAYSVRTKTRRECSLRREEGTHGRCTKVEVEYYDPLDLLIECLGEGGGYWEPSE